MLLLVIGLAFGIPILWAVSVGALRDARRARERDPREGCQAWVRVRGIRGRLYRCGEPVYAGGPWCLRHELDRTPPADLGPDATLVDEPSAVAQALAQARIGIPVAIGLVVVTLGLGIWLVLRA